MAYRHGKPTRLWIKHDIRTIIRTFPSEFVTISRRSQVFNDVGESTEAFVTVYVGEVLVRPSGGSSETYGLGTVENYDLVVLLVGDWNIRQSDVVSVNDGRQYEVMFPPVWFESFMELRLKQRSQITE